MLHIEGEIMRDDCVVQTMSHLPLVNVGPVDCRDVVVWLVQCLGPLVNLHRENKKAQFYLLIAAFIPQFVKKYYVTEIIYMLDFLAACWICMQVKAHTWTDEHTAVPHWQLQPSGLDGWPCRPWRWLASGLSECVSNSSLVWSFPVKYLEEEARQDKL